LLGGKTKVAAAEPLSIPTSISLLSIVDTRDSDRQSRRSDLSDLAGGCGIDLLNRTLRRRRSDVAGRLEPLAPSGFFQVAEIGLDGDHIKGFHIANSSVMLWRITHGF
jgi:hypothetical protein